VSDQSRARFVRRAARERGLDDRYSRILHLIRTHRDEIMRYKHDHDVSAKDAALVVVTMHLLPKDMIP
jgi:hypothetical protein